MKTQLMFIAAIIAASLIGHHFNSDGLGWATFLILCIITHPFEWIEWRLGKNNEKIDELIEEIKKLKEKKD